MIQTALEKGLIFEKEIAEKLRRLDYIHVKITPSSGDFGADIIAIKDGLVCVFQCKKYNKTVGLRAVQEISSAMERYKADKGFVVCDTEFSKQAKSAVENTDKIIELVGTNQLKQWNNLKEEKIAYNPPHPYQKRILRQLACHRRNGNNSALLVMATGLGKTLVAAWDLKRQLKKGNKALFLVHRKDILTQNQEKFLSIINAKSKFKFGIYYNGKKFDKNDEVVFSTFQTIGKHLGDIPKEHFDFIIVDEAHHSSAETYSQILSYFQPKFILGMTATPKRLTKEDNDFIQKRFGKSIANLDLPEALIRNYLCPIKYSIFCDNIDYQKLKSLNKKLSKEQLNRSYFIPTKEEDVERIIRSEAKKIKNPKIIIFCPRIEYIRSVRRMGLFRDAEEYYSDMGSFEKSLIFWRFKAGITKTLLVIDLLNEGVDIPDANIIVFLRTTYSPTVFFQQLGRGLRKIKNKKYLRVLDFVGVTRNLKSVIDAFGHLEIVCDFNVSIEEKKKYLSNIYPKSTLKRREWLEPIELDFFQHGKNIKHQEQLYAKKDFLAEITYLRKHLHKSESWTEEEIISELRLICNESGKFPTIDYLKGEGRQDLIRAMSKNGGVHHFAKLLEYTLCRKPIGYWADWSNYEKEMLPICNKLGHMPSYKYLKDIDRGDLAIATYKYWDGVKIVSKKLNIEPIRKPYGYLDKWENFKKEMLPYCKKLKKFPSPSDLKKEGRHDLLSVLFRKWGFQNAAEKMKYSLSHRKRGDLKLFKNIEEELRPICNQLKRMPTRKELTEMGKGYLATAIHAYHGGFPAIAKKLDLNSTHKPHGYWKDFDNVARGLRLLYKELGRRPTREDLKKKREHGLLNGLSYHGGILKIAKQLELIS